MASSAAPYGECEQDNAQDRDGRGRNGGENGVGSGLRADDSDVGVGRVVVMMHNGSRCLSAGAGVELVRGFRHLFASIRSANLSNRPVASCGPGAAS
ncbi:MAG TPA: hypothetical protein VKJ07_15385, partial [Mycobacteriales bacterium]|nr:hypothetical protein [Mycobacteriales bacterium]